MSTIPANKWSNEKIEKLKHDLSVERPIMLYRAKIEEPTEVLFDMHYVVDVGIVISGQLKRYYTDYYDVINPGQVWFTGIWEPHGWQVTQCPFESVFLFILPELLANMHYGQSPDVNFLLPFITEPSKRPQVLPSQSRIFQELAQKIIKTSEYSSAYQQVFLRTYLVEILLHLYMHWELPTGKSELVSTTFMEINPALHHLFNLRSYMSEEQAATICDMPLKSFNRHFQQVMGVSFAKFALRYRLNGIAIDLLQTSEQIKSIAFKWGFKYLSHLDRCFKNHFKCSPQEYVNRFKKGEYH